MCYLVKCVTHHFMKVIQSLANVPDIIVSGVMQLEDKQKGNVRGTEQCRRYIPQLFTTQFIEGGHMHTHRVVAVVTHVIASNEHGDHLPVRVKIDAL